MRPGTQRERSGEDVGVACDSRAEPLAGLGNFLFRELHALSSCSDGFTRGCEIEQCRPYFDRRLFAKITPSHVDFATQKRTPKASARLYSDVIATNGRALETASR